MTRPLFILLIISLATYSCADTNASKSEVKAGQNLKTDSISNNKSLAVTFTQKAVGVSNNLLLDKQVMIDSSMKLVNIALKYDSTNVSALIHKSSLCYRLKHTECLIEISDRLIGISDNPFFKGQKAMYLSIIGREDEAISYYKKALEQYQEIIAEQDSSDFDIMIEYLGFLESSGEKDSAMTILNKMKNMNYLEYQHEILDMYRDHYVSIETMKKYWRGEIELDQIGKI